MMDILIAALLILNAGLLCWFGRLLLGLIRTTAESARLAAKDEEARMRFASEKLRDAATEIYDRVRGDLETYDDHDAGLEAAAEICERHADELIGNYHREAKENREIQAFARKNRGGE